MDDAAPRAPGGSERLAVPVAFALAALYVLTRSHVHTWDSIAYAARASGDPLLADRYLSTALFHPHHLLYAPLAVAVHRALAPLGLARDPIFPLQLLSAVCGAWSSWVAGRLAARLGATPRRALWVTAVVGISNAVWRFSTEALVMVPSLACLVTGAWVAAGARGRVGWWIAGLAFAGAALIHQSAVVFAAAATAALLWTGRGGRGGPGARGAFTLGWMVPVGLAYLAVGIAETGGFSPRRLVDWAVTAAHRSTSVHATAFSVARDTVLGISEAWVTLAPLRGLGDAGGLGASRVAALAAVGVGALAAAIAVLAALPALARAVRSQAIVVSMLVAGGVSTGALIAGFQPWNHAYWVYFPALGAALVATGLPRVPSVARRLALVAVVAVAAVNLTRALPAMDPSRATYADLVAFARGHFPPGSRLICGGSASPIGEGVIALPFFARVPVVLAPLPGHRDQELRFARLVNEAFAGADGRHALFVTADAVAPLREVRPGLAVRAVGTLRDLEVYRIELSPSSR